MKNKKGMILILFLSILLVLIILPAMYFRLSEKFGYGEKGARFYSQLGKTEIEIIGTYSQAEQSLFYLDQSAKYSAYQAIHDLADNGGFVDKTTCGEVDGYKLYINGENICYYDDLEPVKENFKKIYGEYLIEYLQAYQVVKFPNDYNYTVDGDLKILGTPKSDLIIKIKDYGNYSLKPSFNVNIPYNISDYGKIIARVKKINEACSKDNNTIIWQCVDIIKPENSVVVNYDKSKPRLFKFEVFSNSRFNHYDSSTDLTTLRPVTIKFAVNLRDLSK